MELLNNVQPRQQHYTHYIVTVIFVCIYQKTIDLIVDKDGVCPPYSSQTQSDM